MLNIKYHVICYSVILHITCLLLKKMYYGTCILHVTFQIYYIAYHTVQILTEQNHHKREFPTTCTTLPGIIDWVMV